MKKNTIWLLGIITAASLLFASCNHSGEGKSSNDTTPKKNGQPEIAGLVKVYETDGYILYRKPAFTSDFATGGGSPIDDQVSEDLIKNYQTGRLGAEANQTHYLNFDFEKLFSYLCSFHVGKYDMNKLGLRIYFGKNANKDLTMLLSPTYEHRAMWRKGWSIGKMEEEDVKAFNQGSICPVCADDTDEFPQKK